MEPQTLDDYQAKIIKLSKRYGVKSWALLYQSEARMRGDQFVRWFRTGSAEHEEAVKKGGTHAFNPERPWEWVFRQAINDREFWVDEYTEVATLMKVDNAIIARELGDDAPHCCRATSTCDHTCIIPVAASAAGWRPHQAA